MDLALKLIAILSNSKMAEEVARRGTKFVMEHHSWDAVGKSTRELYLNLLNQ
jgi:glycosyltransferase involved in cell wall biosynthesis